MENIRSNRNPDVSKVSPDTTEVSTPLGLGFISPYQIEKTEHSSVFRVFWGRLLVWLLCGICFGWLFLAGGIYAFVKYRRGFTEVRYSQILALPFGMDEYRHAKGEFFIRQGLAEVEAQKWREGFALLRAGLTSVPENREARLWVARIYLMAGRSDVAADVLAAGLKMHGNELDYLRNVLGFFFGLQADDTIIAFTNELKGRLDPASPAAQMAVTAQAYAYFNRGHYAEALSALEANHLLDSLEGRFVLARVTWAKGQREVALDQMRALVRQVPEDREIYRTLIYYLGEEGLWGEVRRTSLLRQLAMPDQYESYLAYIGACRQEGDTEALQAATLQYLTYFSDDANAMLGLAEHVAQSGDLSLVAKAAERCSELGKHHEEAGLVWVTALLKHNDYPAAEALVIKLTAGSRPWSDRNLVALNGLRAVALYGLKQPLEAEPLVRRLSETTFVSATALTVIAEQLAQVGQPEEALRVLRHATEVDPLNQSALVQRLRLLLARNQLEETPPLLNRLLDMRTPPEELLETFLRRIRSDRYLFAPEFLVAQEKIEHFLQRMAEAKSA